ncbi:hypothetical protein [Variovorax sp. PAMC 28711]|uniref:hypothetical protein n=1 Tax=Variovorax sp. PAMC 28711 TaxID=1795631 RepID=UPI000A7415DE|nr:hypothetical protein [Variovorax sp. PAMC 28711]
MKQKAIRGMARAGMVAGVVLGSSIVWAADEPPLVPPGEAVTRVRFERGSYKPGYETLRVVRRENTAGNVAGQVALSVGLSLLTGNVSFGGQGFSKDQLAGTPLDALQGDPVAINPAMTDLADALSPIATTIYRRRAAEALATARQDGSTPEEIEEAGHVQKEADAPLHPGAWHLVYENLAGTDELYRLKFGAELGRPGFMRPPATCFYESAPVAWTSWQADHWQLLRDERAKAVAGCAEALGKTPEKFW